MAIENGLPDIVTDGKIALPYRFGTDGGADLRAAGLNCVECGTRKVMYYIDEPNAFYKVGAYCYSCLLKIAAATGCIPMPMGQDMLDKLKVDIELTTGKKFRRVY